MSEQQKIRLLITSGDGPKECRLAVSLALKQMEIEASARSLHMVVSTESVDAENAKTGDIASAMVTVSGVDPKSFADRWLGTVQWTAPSPFRPHHKRRNWFVGIFGLPKTNETDIAIDQRDLKFETFRAGGPGGQHQNTTDSAVRVVHIPTGVTAISKDERSQHRNKQTAVERLCERMVLMGQLARDKQKSDANQLHKELERGNPVRQFYGPKFQEK